MTRELRDEYLDLLAWFDIKYAQKEQKYRRLITLKLLCDDGSDPSVKIIELYKLAEVNRRRLQELEVILNAQ